MRRQLLSPSPSNLIWWELLAGLKPSLPAQTLSGLPQLQLCVVHKPIPHHFTLLSTHHLLPNVPYNNLTFIESMPGTVLRLSRCLRLLMTALELHPLL